MINKSKKPYVLNIHKIKNNSNLIKINSKNKIDHCLKNQQFKTVVDIKIRSMTGLLVFPKAINAFFQFIAVPRFLRTQRLLLCPMPHIG